MKKIAATALRGVGSLVPDVFPVRAVPMRVLKPLHAALGLGGGVVDVLGARMRLDPAECVDSWLWFAPHLYDRRELAFLRANYTGGTFLDVGANVGFWSAYVARRWPEAEVLAVEANPDTFALLQENMALNGFGRVRALNIGAAAEDGVLPLYLNGTGNRGGDSLKAVDPGRRAVEVPVRRLSAVLAEQGVAAVEFLKIDIEGMEAEVFGELFANAPERLWPRMICAETSHDGEIGALLARHGYTVALACRENAIYRRA